MIPHIKFKLQRKNSLLYFITSKYGIFILVCNKGETFARSYTSHISDKVLPKNQPTFKRIKKKERKKERTRSRFRQLLLVANRVEFRDENIFCHSRFDRWKIRWRNVCDDKRETGKSARRLTRLEISRIIGAKERRGGEREPGAVSIQCRPRDDLHSYRATLEESVDPSHRRFRSTSSS